MAQRTKSSNFGDRAWDGFDRHRRGLAQEPDGDGGPEYPMPLFLRGEDEPEPASVTALLGGSLFPSKAFRLGALATGAAIALGAALFAGRLFVTDSGDPIAAAGAPANPAQLVLANDSTIGTANPGPSAASPPPREEVAAAFNRARQSATEIRGPAEAAAPARQLDADEVATIMKRARRLIAVGDIASARLLLTRAAEAQDPGAAFVLAQTFDPLVLGAGDARSITTDPAAARDWYQKAALLGSPEAQQRLAQMNN